jgi:hypothetical protein
VKIIFILKLNKKLNKKEKKRSSRNIIMSK